MFVPHPQGEIHTNNIDPTATKYLIKAKLTADGIVEKPDVVGAIFGQTEGLLGDELDLRDLQKSGRIGRIEVEVQSKGGKSEGVVYISSSLDQVETAILASALETIDRVGPCRAGMRVLGIEDVRIAKREQVIERAKELLNELIKQSKGKSSDLTDTVRQSIQVEEITTYGKDHCPAGPNVKDSDSIIIVEGRSDVLNLLKAGIKNAIAVEGTNIPETVQELSREKVATAFVDGDRGGELILRELFQVAEVDFVARAPRAHEVEELSAKQLTKCLRNKVPYDQYMEMNKLTGEEEEEERRYKPREDRREKREERRDREDRRIDREERRRERKERELREKRNRFDTDAANRYKKKTDDAIPADEPVPAEPEVPSETFEEPVPAEVFDEPVSAETIEEPAEEPVTAEPEIPAEIEEGPAASGTEIPEEPVAEPAEEPKKKRVVRKKKTDDDEEVKEKPKITIRKKKDAARQTKTLSPEQQTLRDMLLDMASTHNAKVLNSDGEIVREVAVKNLVDSLKADSDGVATIVFDGVISQRILDVSSANGISTVVGTRKGNISKMPASITILTKEDLY